MRIISSYRDFYDSVGFYSDTPVWVREEIINVVDKTKPNTFTQEQSVFIERFMHQLPKPMLSSENRMYYINNTDSYIVVACCGELTPYYISCDNIPFVSANLYSEYMKNKCELKVAGSFMRQFDDKRIAEWVQTFNSDMVEQLNITANSPIILFKTKRYKSSYIEATINPMLKRYNLQKLIDPFMLCQEIEMFLSNQLAQPEREMPDFDDDIKRDYHGMDEWSFKKQVNTKRRKQKKGKIKK